MALVSLRQLLDHAAENGYGIPAFNVNNLEQVHAIMEAAQDVGAPVIMQASAGARKYAGETFLKYLIEAAVESYPDIPICMHLDHGRSPAACQSAMRYGFTSVMMDGSLMPDGKTPATYEYNVETTRLIVDAAHSIGVSVEGELGCIGSLETLQAAKEDGHGAEGKLTHEPRRLQVHPQAHRRNPVDSTRQGNSRPLAEHAPGDARLELRAAGNPRRNPQVRRSDARNVRRSGRRNSGSHSPRRAQGQCRYRYSPRDDSGHSSVLCRKSERIRSARVPYEGP